MDDPNTQIFPFGEYQSTSFVNETQNLGAQSSESKAASESSATPPWEYIETECAAHVQIGKYTMRLTWGGLGDAEEIRSIIRLASVAPALYEACQAALLAIESATFNPLDASGDHAKRLVVRAMALVNG